MMFCIREFFFSSLFPFFPFFLFGNLAGALALWWLFDGTPWKSDDADLTCGCRMHELTRDEAFVKKTVDGIMGVLGKVPAL